jgi:hypothetical protein
MEHGEKRMRYAQESSSEKKKESGRREKRRKRRKKKQQRRGLEGRAKVDKKTKIQLVAYYFKTKSKPRAQKKYLKVKS